MLQWLFAIGGLGLAVWLAIYWLANRKSSTRKGTAGGAMMVLGLAFMTLFDPAKAESVEEIRKRKDLGDADLGESGEGKD